MTELEQLASSLGRHGPVLPLGEGMDFAAFTCDDLVLRVPKRPEVAALLEAEHALLLALPDDLPLAVPRPVVGAPVMAYPRVPGTPLCELDTDALDVAAVGASLGAFLRELHAVAVREVAPPWDLATWAAAACAELGAIDLDPELAAAAEAILSRPLPGRRWPQVMSHRDLTDDHVLVDAAGRACGVIDFGDAGPAPWWHDFVGISMWGGDAALDAACMAYGRSLDDDETILLECHAVTVAVWDTVRAAPEDCPAEVAILRRLLG